MREAKPTTRTTTPKRFHLSSVRELHTGVGSARDAGASVNYTRAPAWIQFEPDGDAVVAVAGGCPVARGDVRGNTVDVAALARDARADSSSSRDASPSSLLVSIREDTRGKRQGHAVSLNETNGTNGTTFVSRALVLGFHSAREAREARATLSPSSAAKKDLDTFANGRTTRDDDDAPKRKSTAVTAEDDLFTRKIDIGSAERYFSYYASLAEQQNMLQDRVRTGTYFTAILEHRAAFEGAIVMDVGAGSGVLSCFAALAGARRVYAVEASDMADHCARLVASDARLRDVVKVIKGRVESEATRREILEDLSKGLSKSPLTDSRVFDVLVSEPMGTMLLNERMIESFLIARDVFLKPRGGAMFPRAARMHCAPYEDAALRDEIENKAAFWTCASSKDFYGIDVSVLGDAARKAVFAQPVVDAFDPAILLAPPATFEFDFESSRETSIEETRASGAFALAAEHLESLRLEADFVMHRGGAVHGVAWWFDVEFDVRLPGGEPGPHRRFLTTAPGAPTTHWFQIRAPIRDESGVLERVEKNTRLSVATTMAAGSDQSYAVTSRLEVLKAPFKGSTPGTRREPNAALGSWNLKDPYYRQLHWPQPGYTQAQTERWYGDETT